MNFYNLLKINKLIKDPRIKFLGLYLLHKTGQRYLSLNFDPVMACNLRCKMCYFTDREYVKKKMKGVFPEEDLETLAKNIFPRGIKLQVGCGTEPTLYKNLDRIFELAKKYGVPNIAITTNANLITAEKAESWAKNGLKEFIISLHGITKEEYEDFMERADYEKFHSALKVIHRLKTTNPEIKLRINYTFNKDNFHSLKHFFELYGKYQPDVLQIRPMKIMGNTTYQDNDISDLKTDYNSIISQIIQEGKRRDMTILASPTYKSLSKSDNVQSVIYDFVYCYIRPGMVWREDFDWKNESFNQYSKRTKWANVLLKNALASKDKIKTLSKKNSLKYDVIN